MRSPTNPEIKAEKPEESLTQNDDFIKNITCPITMKIFYDPVHLNPCGHDFEREAINEHQKKYNSPVCPICRAPFKDLSESHSLRSIVDQVIKNRPELQNERYFTIKHLSYVLQTGNKVELEKLCSILKSSHYLNAISDEKDFQGSSALTELMANRPMGRSAILKDPVLRQLVTQEGLNATLKVGYYRGSSAVYWMMAFPSDSSFSSIQDLFSKITAEGLNSSRQEGPDRGKCALFLLAYYTEGRALLADPELRSKITAEGLNSIIQEGVSGGKSALICLAESPEGRALLAEDPELRSKIRAEGLNSLIQEGAWRGRSALFCLSASTKGRALLADPELRSKITAEGLNSVIQEGAERGQSALIWLAGTPEGQTLLAEDLELRSKIRAEGLNSVVQEGASRGRSALFCLSVTPTGRALLAEDPELRSKITGESLNSIAREGDYLGESALSNLAYHPVGRALLLNNPHLVNLINIDTLMQVVEGKQSAYQHLCETPEGQEIFRKYPKLQKKIAKWDDSNRKKNKAFQLDKNITQCNASLFNSGAQPTQSDNSGVGNNDRKEKKCVLM